jgi:uncharacterized protein (DUF1330 family)
MSAFIIVDTKINNPEIYETYKAQAKPIAEKFGGIYRVRGGGGGELDIMETDSWVPTRVVIIEFPNMAIGGITPAMKLKLAA